MTPFHRRSYYISHHLKRRWTNGNWDCQLLKVSYSLNASCEISSIPNHLGRYRIDFIGNEAAIETLLTKFIQITIEEDELPQSQDTYSSYARPTSSFRNASHPNQQDGMFKVLPAWGWPRSSRNLLKPNFFISIPLPFDKLFQTAMYSLKSQIIKHKIANIQSISMIVIEPTQLHFTLHLFQVQSMDQLMQIKETLQQLAPQIRQCFGNQPFELVFEPRIQILGNRNTQGQIMNKKTIVIVKLDRNSENKLQQVVELLRHEFDKKKLNSIPSKHIATSRNQVEDYQSKPFILHMTVAKIFKCVGKNKNPITESQEDIDKILTLPMPIDRAWIDFIHLSQMSIYGEDGYYHKHHQIQFSD